MNTRMSRSLAHLGAGAALLVTSACTTMTPASSGGDVMPAPRSMNASAMLAGWPMKQRDAGMMMVQKYGEPDVMGDRMMTWMNEGPYTKIVLMRDEVQHNFPMPHVDFLAHTVKHAVPADKVNDLFMFDGSLWVHRTRGEMTAECDLEAHNLIALNLGHDVAMGRKTVAQARADYVRLAMAHKNGDRSDPYTQRLVFAPEPNAAWPDRAP